MGRESELGQLVQALDESRHQARFAVVEGDPGIGKTRLADQLGAVAAERGALVVWGRSDEGGAAPSLWPWLPPLRRVAERASEVPPVIAELLAGDAPVAAGLAGAVQFERFGALADVLDAVAAEQPLVILLDDLQWADDTSLELLAFLAGRAASGLLVVGTMRPLEVGRNDAVTDALASIARRAGSRRIHLRGLGREATAAVLEAVANRPVPAADAAAIHARAEGNPFYAIELARLLADEGDARGDVPSSVGDVIRRRLGRLPAETLDLLRVAAVVGRDVELGLLAGAAQQPLDAVLDGLEPAVVHRLLVEVPDQPAELRFSHALVREVLLDGLTSLKRARLHLRAADAIESRGAGINDAEILAEHLWRAAPVGVGGRAADALERAAEVAVRRLAYGSAEDLLAKAVDLRRATGSSVEEQEAELLAISRMLEVARARRYFQAAGGHEVFERAKELAARCGRTDVLIDVSWFEYSAMATSVQIPQAVVLANAILDITEGHPDPTVRSIGRHSLGVLAWEQGRIADAVGLLDEAETLYEGAPPPANSFAAERQMVCHMFWLFNHAAHGDLDPERIWADFHAVMDAVDDRFVIASICGFGATTAIAVGAWDEVERFVARNVEADPNAQFAFWSGQMLMQRGVVEARRGQVDAALVGFEEGRRLYVDIGARSGLPAFHAALAAHLADQGRLDDAAAHLEAARELVRERGELWHASTIRLGEAVLAHRSGDPAAAAERFVAAVEVATEQGAHALAARAAEVAAELGVDLPTS